MSSVARHWRWIGLAALLLLYVSLRLPRAEGAEPPLLFIVEQATVVYGPLGERIDIPSGAEIDVCAGQEGMLVYEFAPRVVRAPYPCRERPLFRDGFEL